MPRISPDARRALVEERREQILKAASQVFAEKGFARATIADIARRAGVAEGSIYNYFKNKDDLLVSIPHQIVQPPVEALSAQLDKFSSQVPPEQMLETLARNMIAAVSQNAHIFRILVTVLPQMKQAMREKYLEQAVLYATGILQVYFEKQIELGVFRRNLDSRVLARTFVGMFFPYVMLREILRVERDADWDYDSLIQQIVPLFLHGVMADTAERKK